MKKGKVLIGMSGGIDSTVSAMLLLEQGYELVGCTFRTFDSIKESCLAREKGCCSVESIMEARNMAKQLGFEHHIVDFREIFEKKVIGNFVSEYLHGRTPNPCVLCNSHIKWGELVRVADEYGCDYIATGHYARIAEKDGHYFLRRAVDEKKDQTYFLWMLTEDNLKRTIFPLGGYTKEQVRRIAAEKGYVKLSQKTESQDICFIPNGDYRSFLLSQEQAACSKAFESGTYIDGSGSVVGKHEGFANYTIGQRKGLGVALGYPAFVTRIDAEKNEVELGRREDLDRREVRVKERIFRGDVNKLVMAQIRYRSKPSLARYENGKLTFDEPVWAVTPGQSAVMYQDDLLVGGGLIE